MKFSVHRLRRLCWIETHLIALTLWFGTGTDQRDSHVCVRLYLEPSGASYCKLVGKGGCLIWKDQVPGQEGVAVLEGAKGLHFQTHTRRPT